MIWLEKQHFLSLLASVSRSTQMVLMGQNIVHLLLISDSTDREANFVDHQEEYDDDHN